MRGSILIEDMPAFWSRACYIHVEWPDSDVAGATIHFNEGSGNLPRLLWHLWGRGWLNRPRRVYGWLNLIEEAP